MKKFIQFLGVAAFSFMLMGCPYETEVPISEPSVKFPAELLGKWEPKGSADDVMTIKRKTDFIVSVSKTKKNPGADDKPEEFEAFLSEVGALTFLNISEVGEQSSDGAYYLYKMVVAANGSSITLSAVTENIDEQFNSSAELKAFIQKNMQHSFFYEKEEEVYQKIGK
jgi:hypothetical protein